MRMPRGVWFTVYPKPEGGGYLYPPPVGHAQIYGEIKAANRNHPDSGLKTIGLRIPRGRVAPDGRLRHKAFYPKGFDKTAHSSHDAPWRR
jgi:hypothetical protein